jgi:hypothetical protein
MEAEEDMLARREAKDGAVRGELECVGPCVVREGFAGDELGGNPAMFLEGNAARGARSGLRVFRGLAFGVFRDEVGCLFGDGAKEAFWKVC